MNYKTPFCLDEESALQIQDIGDAFSQLASEVNAAFKKLDCGKAKFISHEKAKSEMAERKAKIRSGE